MKCRKIGLRTGEQDGVQENREEYRSTGEQDGEHENRTEYRRTGKQN